MQSSHRICIKSSIQSCINLVTKNKHMKVWFLPPLHTITLRIIPCNQPPNHLPSSEWSRSPWHRPSTILHRYGSYSRHQKFLLSLFWKVSVALPPSQLLVIIISYQPASSSTHYPNVCQVSQKDGHNFLLILPIASSPKHRKSLLYLPIAGLLMSLYI